MARTPIGVQEQRVRAVAQQHVPEGILVLAGEPRWMAGNDEVLGLEEREPFAGGARAEQRVDAALPEYFAENTRGAQNRAGLNG